jgi:asparagine synthase (glutamine-hydrolysing)
MCGIAGIISDSVRPDQVPLLNEMIDSLAHRGPDGTKIWHNVDGTVGLAHRRLAILDRSDAGAQPFHYLHYTITYNGEIYNYRELRKILEDKGYAFHTQTDTEVIVAAYDCWKTDCVLQFDGMFAFLIWDAHTKTAFMARDAFGEKPFYYAIADNRFYFGSEMKALWTAGITKKLQPGTILRFLALGITYSGTANTDSGYEGISQLPAAHGALYHPQTQLMELRAFPVWRKPSATPNSLEEAIKEFDCLLETSIARRLRSDVPVGTSFSGGLDSNTIKWYIERLGTTEFQTFSAIFPGFEKDESALITSATQTTKTNSHTICPTAQDLLANMSAICHHQELPFDSASVCAQYLVYQLARKEKVPVLLDGQGADEVLAGYSRYIHWYLQELIMKGAYQKMRTEKKALIKNQVPFSWGITNWAAAWLPHTTQQQVQQHAFDAMNRYPFMEADFKNHIRKGDWIEKPVVHELNDMLTFDLTRGPLQTLLRYADRNAMAHGCEARLPFLQRELVGFLMDLPAAYKIHQGFTKNLLRRLMQHRIPDSICWNPKKIGFEPPQAQWLRDPEVQVAIQQAKQKLVHAGILDKSVMQRPIQPGDAYGNENYDWRWWVCAVCME